MLIFQRWGCDRISCIHMPYAYARDHRCRSRLMFGSGKDFWPNFPKLAGKFFCHFLCKNFLMKTFSGIISKKRSSCDSANIGRHFFQIKPRWAPFLSVFPRSLARFSGILRRFLQIVRFFHRIKTFGGSLSPPPPTPLPEILKWNLTV